MPHLKRSNKFCWFVQKTANHLKLFIFQGWSPLMNQNSVKP
jgi:hypothetical protein